MVSWRERKKYQVIFLSLLSRIGRWKFYAKDGRRIIVSYEDKKYRKGIIIEEGFLHGHFDYFY